MNKTPTTKAIASTILLCSIVIMFQCSESEVLPNRATHGTSTTTPTRHSDSTSSGPISPYQDCSKCTYVVPEGQKIVDGKVLGFKPGNVIGLSSKIKYGSIEFHNLIGAPGNPIVITNCDGTANIVSNNKWHAIRTDYSKHFRITGGYSSGHYGIKIRGGEMGLKLDNLSTDFEVDHVEVSNTTFAGIMAKTDPNCSNATIRGNFTMTNVSIHDNYVHDTRGEGLYIGNSFWNGMQRPCGLRLPHEIRHLQIYNNKVENTGWEAIQVGCAIEGTRIFNNEIRNFGTANKHQQNNGIQIGAGTGGEVFNNFIKHGTGNGMIVMGTGDNLIHDNIIIDTGQNGIFCDERYTPGNGFRFINNTIINPGNDGIRLYAELVPMNVIANNIIANPGSLGTHKGKRTDNDAFVYLLNSKVRVELSNNIFARTVEELRLVNPSSDNYRLSPDSPAINSGKDISQYKIELDFYNQNRRRGPAFDIGASEH